MNQNGKHSTAATRLQTMRYESELAQRVRERLADQVEGGGLADVLTADQAGVVAAWIRDAVVREGNGYRADQFQSNECTCGLYGISSCVRHRNERWGA